MKKERNNTFKNLIYSFKVIYKNEKSIIFLSILQMLCSVLQILIDPLILSIAINAIEKGYSLKYALTQTIVICIIVAIIAIINGFTFPLLRTREVRLYNKLCFEYNKKSLDIDYELFERPETQDLFTRSKVVIRYGGSFINNTYELIKLVKNIIIFIGTGTIITLVSPLLLPVIIVIAVLIGLVTMMQSKTTKKFYDDVTPLNRKMNYTNSISKNITIMKDKKIYEMNKFIDDEHQIVGDEILKLDKKYQVKICLIGILSRALYVAREVILYLLIGIEVILGKISIAIFSYTVTAIKSLSNAISGFVDSYNQIYNNSLYINDYHKLKKLEEDDSDSKRDEVDYSNIENVKIEFKNVSYRYYKQEGLALDNVSFTIENGKRLALVGENGAGKTTIVKLLCGYYHPISGEILINGKNIETIKRKSLNKLIAPVFQENNIYSLTVKENITMVNSDIDNEYYDEVKVISGIDKKIEELDKKDDAIINRDIYKEGIDLSGGERQKIDIARSTYKNSPLLILDEPTSNLDAFAERFFYDNLDKIIKNHSSIFISHRLSSSKFCDEIIVLEKGKIVESGTHKELMELNGKYANLFSVQAELYNDNEVA